MNDENVKSAREFAAHLLDAFNDLFNQRVSGVNFEELILSRDKLIEAEAFHNALECLVDEIETGELLTPKLKAALAEHDRELERRSSEFRAQIGTAGRDPFRKLLEGLDPFNGGRDGDECLWCRRSRPRDLTSWQETRNSDYHDLDCEFVAAILALEDRGPGRSGT